MAESENGVKILAAELAHELPKLDLHGRFPEDGTLNEIDQFLYKNFNERRPSAGIVYGIGEGRMREFVLDFLKKHPLVEGIVEQQGSCRVVISEKID